MGNAHPAFRADAVGAIYPHVLGGDLALLRELKVFLELRTSQLERTCAACDKRLTLAALETIVDSAMTAVMCKEAGQRRKV
jgi:hypothetical protein